MIDIEFSGVWHLLSEKLPEHDSSVLIAFNDGEVFDARYKNSEKPLFHWYPFDHVISNDVELFEGAYWCYMPEHPNYKPKPETDEDREFAARVAVVVAAAGRNRQNMVKVKTDRMVEHIGKCLSSLDESTISNVGHICVSEDVYEYVRQNYARKLLSLDGKIKPPVMYLGLELKPEPDLKTEMFYLVTKSGSTIKIAG